MKNINLNTVLFVGIAVLGTILLMETFGGSHSRADQATVKAKDELIKIITEERNHYRQRADSLLSVQRDRDTTLIKETKIIQNHYEKIPSTINAYSRDSLRAAVKRYTLPAN